MGDAMNLPAASTSPSRPYDPDDLLMQWIVALAEGFRRAGCTHAPIVPDPEVIRRCIETRAKQEAVCKCLPAGPSLDHSDDCPKSKR